MARRKNERRRLQAEARQAARRAQAREEARRRELDASVRPRKQRGSVLAALDEVISRRGLSSRLSLEVAHVVRHDHRLAPFRKLIATVEPRARRMVRRRLRALWTLNTLLVPDAAWRPKSRAPDAQLKHLVDHHLLKWAVPAWAYQAFDSQDAGWSADDQSQLFLHLTEGGGLKLASQLGLLPVPLSRRQLHALRVLPDRCSPLEAIRKVQVVDAGGTSAVARAVAGSRLGSTVEFEAYVAGLVPWIVRQALRPAEVGPVVDYLMARRPALRGRTLRTIRVDMIAWHVELHRRDHQHGLPERFEPSGLPGLVWPTRRAGCTHVWSTHELLTPMSLAQEGRSMQHCVWSYAWRAARGEVSIWSLQLDGRRRCTVEVRKGAIVQVRGRQNRLPEREERVALGRWAAAAGLSLRA